MAVPYTNLKHLDGRTQSRPTAGYEKNKATYEAAGWREDGAGAAPEAAGIRIVSLHNQEKTVTAAEFAEVYEPAGWKRVDEKGAEAKPDGGDAEATDTKPAVKKAL